MIGGIIRCKHSVIRPYSVYFKEIHAMGGGIYPGFFYCLMNFKWNPYVLCFLKLTKITFFSIINIFSNTVRIHLFSHPAVWCGNLLRLHPGAAKSCPHTSGLKCGFFFRNISMIIPSRHMNHIFCHGLCMPARNRHFNALCALYYPGICFRHSIRRHCNPISGLQYIIF